MQRRNYFYTHSIQNNLRNRTTSLQSIHLTTPSANKGQSKSSLLYTLPTKQPPKEDNLPTKDNPKVPFYTHSLQNNLRKWTTSLQRTIQKFPSIHTPYKTTSESGQPLYKGQSKSSLLYTLPTKQPPKVDNLSTKDNLKVPFYTHSLQNNL